MGTCLSAAPRAAASATATQGPLNVPMASLTAAAICVTTATTADQAQRSVPMGTCSSAYLRAAVSATATLSPLSVPMASCNSCSMCNHSNNSRSRPTQCTHGCMYNSCSICNRSNNCRSSPNQCTYGFMYISYYMYI